MGKKLIISRKDIGRYAEHMLGFFEHNKIEVIQDFSDLLQKKEIIDTTVPEYIFTELRDSSEGTKAYTISYIVGGGGIPLELKINPTFGYTKIILKCEESIPGYKNFPYPCTTDLFENIIQDSKIKTINVPEIKCKLNDLTL